MFNKDIVEIIQTILLILILISVNQNVIKKSKLFVKRMLLISIYLLSKLFPKTSKIIVFGAESGKGFRGNPKYLFLRMKQEPGIRCIWIAKGDSVISQMTKMGHEAYKHTSLKGMYFQLRAKLVIHSHSINDDFNKVLLGGATSYNTWHGVGLKKVWGANKKTFTYKVLHEKNPLKKWYGMLAVVTNLAKKNFVVSTSETVSSYYPETFLVDKENVLEMGQVRNDIFFNVTEEDLQIPDCIRDEKVILYMPTHRDFGKLDTDINMVFDFEVLDDFCEQNGYKFIIKTHMYSRGSIPKRFKNIIDVSNKSYEPQFLLKYANILVTDYSSCYTDYLLLDRPVIFYCYDLEMYLQKSNEMYFDFFDVTPGAKPRSFTEFIDSLKESILQPELYQKDRSRVLDIFYSKNNQGVVLEEQIKYIKSHLIGT